MKDKIKKLSELATKYGDLKEMQEKTQKLFKDYEEFKIPMVFIGEFSAGKSSLINAIIDEELLDVDTTPTTAKPCEICYSEEENRYNKDGVEILYLKNPNLEKLKNLKLVDLPGISSQYFEHMNVVKDYLANRDTIFVVAIDVSKGAISEEVLNFIRDFKAFNKDYILVVNKTDKVSEEDSNTVLNNTISVLRDNYKVPMYSCKSSVANSDISGVISILNRYNNKYDEIRNNIFMNQFKELALEMKTSLEGIRDALKLYHETDMEKIETEIKELELAISEIESKKSEEIDKIKRSVKKEFDELILGLENDIRPKIEVYLKDPNQLPKDINDYLQNSPQSKELNEKLSNIFQKAINDLNESLSDLKVLNSVDSVLSTITNLASSGTAIKGLATFAKGLLATESIAEILGLADIGLTGAGAAATGTGAVVAGEAAAGAATAGEAAVAGMSATGVLLPVALIGTVVIHQIFDKIKRDKTKEAIEKAIGNVKKEVENKLDDITDNMTKVIIDNYMSQVKQMKDQLSQIKNTKLSKVDDKNKINQIESDIKLLENYAQ